MTIDLEAIAAERARIRNDYLREAPERRPSSARGLHHFALLCAEVCQTCADDCVRLEGMEVCVSACRRCVAACQALGGPDAEIRVEASHVAPSQNGLH